MKFYRADFQEDTINERALMPAIVRFKFSWPTGGRRANIAQFLLPSGCLACPALVTNVFMQAISSPKEQHGKRASPYRQLILKRTIVDLHQSLKLPKDLRPTAL